jgi:hypothetical protein
VFVWPVLCTPATPITPHTLRHIVLVSVPPTPSSLPPQALCEIYDRPADIYAYDAGEGARKLRTFHSGRSVARPSVVLSYYGGGHYDSITGPGFERALLTSAPGEVERRFFARLEARQARAGAPVSGAVCVALCVALCGSRCVFCTT